MGGLLAAFIAGLAACYAVAINFGAAWGLPGVAIMLILARRALKFVMADFRSTDLADFSRLTHMLREMTHTGMAATLLVAAHPTWSEAVLAKKLTSMYGAVAGAERLLAFHSLTPSAPDG